MAPRTQRDYQQCFDYLKPIADTPLVRFDRPLVVGIRDKAATSRKRRFANYVRAVLSVLFAWGLEHGYVDTNPVQGVKDIRRPRGAPKANRPWTDEERFAALDSTPWHLKVPIALAMFCGTREGDVLAVSRSSYNGTTIAFETQDRVTYQLASAAVAEGILDEAPKHDAATLAVNSRSQSWTESGFRASWRKFRMQLENAGQVAPGLTIHGLRHTVATNMREEGFDDRTIADGASLLQGCGYLQEDDRSVRHAGSGREQKTVLKSCQTALGKVSNQNNIGTFG